MPRHTRFASDPYPEHWIIRTGAGDIYSTVAANAMSKAERAFDVVALRLEELSRLEQSLSERDYAGAEADFGMLSTWKFHF